MAGGAGSLTERSSKSGGFSGKIVLGLIALLLGVTFLLELKWNKETEKLSLRTCFQTAPGLNQGAPVIMSGIASGFVANVAVESTNAECPVRVDILLNIKSGTRIPSDSTVGLHRDKAMGDTEAVIHLGKNGDASLEEGDSLKAEN